jgi:hypothetical protein
MIWTLPICNNFINLRLRTKQLLAKHIPLPRYIRLPSPWELPDGFTEPFFRGVAVPPTDSRCCSYPVEHSAACRCFLSTTCRQPTINIRRCNAFLAQEPRGPSLPLIIAFHFATPVHILRPLDGNDAAASHRHARLGPFGGECCTKT